MKTVEYFKAADESCKIYKHKSGIPIYVIEKPDFNTSFAVYGTKYGSIDTIFKKEDEVEFTKVPEGIAHFLEHKLFENEDCDVFEKFSKLGASDNAFTSFDRTCYYFSCTENFDECFKILLDFVQNPYFTKETVEKEQGIIGQEISMYDDSPFWMLMFDMLGAMYHSHPIKINICGTKESIAKITPELLYQCYDTFYNPANMFICVCGNVKAENVFDLADECLKDKAPVKVESTTEFEPYEIVKSYTERNMPVSKPIVAVGFKEKPINKENSAKDWLIYDIIRSMIFDTNSDFAVELLEKGLINSNIEPSAYFGNNYLAMMIFAEADDPKAFYDAVIEKVKELHKNGLDKATFERIKKVAYGNIIRSFDDIEGVAMNMIEAPINNYGVFEMNELYSTITFEDVNNAFADRLDIENSVLSVINPMEA